MALCTNFGVNLTKAREEFFDVYNIEDIIPLSRMEGLLSGKSFVYLRENKCFLCQSNCNIFCQSYCNGEFCI